MRTSDIVVVGGGIVGLSAAIAMRLRGLSVSLLDAGELEVNLSQPSARVYAINQATKNLFMELNVWDMLDKERVSSYLHMHVWDSKQGAEIDFDARMVGQDALGAIIEEDVIKAALLQKSQELEIELLAKTEVCEVRTFDDKVLITDSDTTRAAKLLIVADGAQSKTRDILQVPYFSKPYHQQAIVALVHTEKSHQQTAYQVFRPNGPLAFLPLRDKNTCSIVWSTTENEAKHLLSLSEKEFRDELTLAFASKLGMVTKVGKLYKFPLIMRHVKQYSGQRFILMGDAAHTIHPLAGQGLNEGLADLSAWLSYFTESKNPLESKRILGAYQRQRKTALWKTIVLMEGLNDLFSNAIPPLVWARGFGLNVCNNLLPLKRLFIEHAAG